MKNIFIISSLLLFAGFVHGQQYLGGLNYLNNPMVINPAATGFRLDGDPLAKIFLANQTQWLKMRNAPLNASLSGDIKFRKNEDDSPMGLGASLDVSNYHLFSKYHFKTNYAYHLRFGKGNNHFLSLGTSLGFLYQKVNIAKANPSDPSDMLLTSYQSPSLGLTNDVGVAINLLFDTTIINTCVSYRNVPLGWLKYEGQTLQDTTVLFKLYPTLTVASKVLFLKKRKWTPGFMVKFDWQTKSTYPITQTDFLALLNILDTPDSNLALRFAVGTSVNFGINSSINKGFLVPICTSLNMEIKQKFLLGFAYRNTSTATQLGVGDSFEIQIGYFIDRKSEVK